MNGKGCRHMPCLGCVLFLLIWITLQVLSSGRRKAFLCKRHIWLFLASSFHTVGVVVDPSKKNTTCLLKKPICANPGDRITISRRVGDRFRLIGYGILKETK